MLRAWQVSIRGNKTLQRVCRALQGIINRTTAQRHACLAFQVDRMTKQGKSNAAGVLLGFSLKFRTLRCASHVLVGFISLAMTPRLAFRVSRAPPTTCLASFLAPNAKLTSSRMKLLSSCANSVRVAKARKNWVVRHVESVHRAPLHKTEHVWTAQLVSSRPKHQS